MKNSSSSSFLTQIYENGLVSLGFSSKMTGEYSRSRGFYPYYGPWTTQGGAITALQTQNKVEIFVFNSVSFPVQLGIPYYREKNVSSFPDLISPFL